VTPESIVAALRPDTLLVSLMHTNNETGVMQPVAEVAIESATPLDVGLRKKTTAEWNEPASHARG
jgi:hypothetical protein